MKGLKEKREEKKLTQKELGELVGLSARTIYQYEAGVRDPKIKTLKNLAKVLNCKVDDLL